MNMDLFAIERYAGDSPSTSDTSAKESQRLEELLEQAKRRKRQRDISDTKCRGEDETLRAADVSLKEKDVKKKRKSMVKKKSKSKLKEQRKPKHDNNEDGDQMTGDREKATRGRVNDPEDVGNTDKSVASLKENAPTAVPQPSNSHKKTSKHVVGERKSEFSEEMTVIGGQRRKDHSEPVRRILPRWLSRPFLFSDDVQNNLIPVSKLECLDHEFVKKLENQGIEHFFPVQQVVIQEVLSCWETRSPFGRGGFLPPDICVCAPTGSGKTLAYVLPIIQLLKMSVLRRLEALVIVPTKDLATQVCNVFKVNMAGTNMKVGLANGLKSFQREQEQLGRNSTNGYSSYVNILVATPGRLVEHISSTIGFTLQFIRFFVIDEADRLLAEPYFGWLNKVYNSAFSSSSVKNEEESRFPPHVLTSAWFGKIQRPFQKLLFSATLTQNPEKLAPLQLYRPKFFTVSKSSSAEIKGVDEFVLNTEEDFLSVSQTPSTLQESMYLCNSGGKPLVLLYLLTELGLDRVLCFTSSVQSTHRLYLLVKHFGGIEVTEFSSTLTAVQRKTILDDFNSGKTQLIICSDAMARGLDLCNVMYVVSYDPPVSSKTYIHRVGRTARAGKTGTAITLLHDTEVFHFKKMLNSLRKTKIPKHSVKNNVLEPLMERYEEALEKLKTEVTCDKTRSKRKRSHSAKGTK